MKEEVVSAVNGASNPAFEAIKEANEALGGACRISCLLTLGAGKQTTSSVNTYNLLKQTAHDTETTAGELQTSFGKLGMYFRFSVEHGLDSEKVTPGMIAAHTSSYLQDAMVSQRLDECASACSRISSTLLSSLRMCIVVILCDVFTYSETQFATRVEELSPTMAYLHYRRSSSKGEILWILL